MGVDMKRTVQDVRGRTSPRPYHRTWSQAKCKLIFGATEAAVRRNLVSLIWCGKKITVHKKVVPSLKRIEESVRSYEKAHGKPKWVPERVDTFNWRPIRGGTTLSKHSFGVALDINPADNPYYHTYNSKLTMNLPLHVIRAFQAEKWDTGYWWNSPCDTMHISYCGG